MRPVPVPWSPATLNPSPPDDRRKVTSACGPARNWRRYPISPRTGEAPAAGLPHAAGGRSPASRSRSAKWVQLLTHRAHASSAGPAAPDGGRAMPRSTPPVSFLPGQAGSATACRLPGGTVAGFPWSGGIGHATVPARPLPDCDISMDTLLRPAERAYMLTARAGICPGYDPVLAGAGLTGGQTGALGSRPGHFTGCSCRYAARSTLLPLMALRRW